MGLTAHVTTHNPVTQFAVEKLANFLDHQAQCDLQVRLWDGTILGTDHPRLTLFLKSPGVLRKMFYSPTELTLAESYIYGEIDVEGDLEAVFDFADYLLTQLPPQDWKSQLARVLLHLPEAEQFPAAHPPAALDGSIHSKVRDHEAVTFHYDLPLEFFALWLDQRMLYSCAYFFSREESLDRAQYRKLDYICRKLRLQPGERLLDIGCGWGGLLVHAASCYGVQAIGITLSVPQAEVARKRIRECGLQDRCRVEVCDYRDLEIDQPFDKIASVGMFEHVGEAQLPEYFSVAWRLLRPCGAFLNVGIARSATNNRPNSTFIDRYVFPDGELVPLSSGLAVAEKCGFEVRDVESLREHYALTLEHWVQRLQMHAERAKSLTDEISYRIWRLYMAGSAYQFRAGLLNLYQVLMAKPLKGESGMPLTRSDWYHN